MSDKIQFEINEAQRAILILYHISPNEAENIAALGDVDPRDEQ